MVSNFWLLGGGIIHEDRTHGVPGREGDYLILACIAGRIKTEWHKNINNILTIEAVFRKLLFLCCLDFHLDSLIQLSGHCLKDAQIQLVVSVGNSHVEGCLKVDLTEYPNNNTMNYTCNTSATLHVKKQGTQYNVQ